MKKTVEECLLCLRIPPGIVLKYAHEVWKEENDAHKVGVKAAEIIRTAYLRNPPKLCGRSPRSVLGAALYIAGVILGKRKTQKEIARIINTTEVSIRNNYKTILSIIPELKEYFPELATISYHKLKNYIIELLKKVTKPIYAYPYSIATNLRRFFPELRGVKIPSEMIRKAIHELEKERKIFYYQRYNKIVILES